MRCYLLNSFVALRSCFACHQRWQRSRQQHVIANSSFNNRQSHTSTKPGRFVTLDRFRPTSQESSKSSPAQSWSIKLDRASKCIPSEALLYSPHDSPCLLDRDHRPWPRRRTQPMEIAQFKYTRLRSDLDRHDRAPNRSSSAIRFQRHAIASRHHRRGQPRL